jgi:hypothetical protein
MATAEEKLGYDVTEATSFRVRVQVDRSLEREPDIEWITGCESLIDAQRAYITLRDALGYGASQFGFGKVFDQTGLHVAEISYNGRLWAPAEDRVTPWRPGVLAIAEAPEDLEDEGPRP